jgi:hypothetical protein
MKKLSEDMQKVYDFCTQKQNIADKNLEYVNGNMLLNQQFVAEGTAYWAVRQFIEVNFME